MWRHGDVLISVVEDIPKDAIGKKVDNLAWGGVIGRSHRIVDPKAAELFEKDGELFIRVLADKALLIHEEHVPITLFKGNYKFWFKQDFGIQADLFPNVARRMFD